MANKVLLVSPTFIRENSMISNNIQDKFLITALTEATDINLREIVGDKMLKKLKALVADNTIHDDENIHYKELLDIARYYLMYEVIQKVIMISSFKIDNAGLYISTDTNVENPKTADVFSIKNYYKSQSDFYRTILQGFLNENSKYFKELFTNNCNEMPSHLSKTASCPIFLYGARGKKTRRKLAQF